MTAPATSSPQPTLRTRDRILVLVLGALLFLPGLGNHDLWNPDEPRYAEVVREMRLTGDYLVPHLNGEVYSQKPPLLFWAITASATVRGRLDEVAVRLPSAISGVLALLVVLEIGQRLFDRRAAWLAVAVFATSLKIPFQARTAQIDMLLVLLVGLAVLCWVRGYLERSPGWYRAFFAVAGLATLAKGPVGLLPPLLSIVAFLVITRDRDQLKRLGIGSGLAIWAAVVLAWLVPAGLAAGPDYLEAIVLKQNVTRYLDPWHHYRPFYYYLPVVLIDFLPWSFLAPAALLAGRRTLEGASRRRLLFPICWAVVTVLFFSISPAKRSVYVLTMYPGLAVVVGAGLDAMARGWPRGRHWLVWPLGALGVVMAGVAAAVPVVARARAEAAAFDPWYPIALAAMLAVAAAVCGCCAVLAWRGRVRAAIATLAAGFAAVGLTAALVLLPPFDALKSARPLARLVAQRLPPGERFGLFPSLEPPFLYYSERLAIVLPGEQELRAFASRPEPVWVIAERPALAKIAAPLPLHEVARDEHPTAGYVLLTNQP